MTVLPVGSSASIVSTGLVATGTVFSVGEVGPQARMSSAVIMYIFATDGGKQENEATSSRTVGLSGRRVIQWSAAGWDYNTDYPTSQAGQQWSYCTHGGGGDAGAAEHNWSSSGGSGGMAGVSAASDQAGRGASV